MFSFLKSKPIKKICLGVIERDDFTQEDLDSCLVFFEKAFNNKLFEDSRLLEFSNKLGFDVTNYYYFTDYEDWNGNKKDIQINLRYRLIGSQFVSDEIIEKRIESLNKLRFYTRSEIETLSEIEGFSVFDRCEFKPYIIHQYIFGKLKQIANIVQQEKEKE